ncbi:uncharacterized protein LOC127095246 [Lathyrus oleraceus]|uniref:uncharacterized protein LOC127095246 n=1 Tax=Pisum sativum TaxID=3888 RepID=UPI0021CE5B90|nr:uncharacterized protein LOC127095246 [Pisum sativum]
MEVKQQALKAASGKKYQKQSWSEARKKYDDTSEFKGSEDESKSEDTSEGDSESESDSEDEFDYEGESDSDPDSDDDSDSCGDLDSASKEGSEQVKRPQRIRNIPRRFAEFDILQDTEIDSEGEVIMCDMLVDSETVSVEEALKTKVWLKAMEEELNAIERHKTWELTERPKDKKSISVIWVFKMKLKTYGSFGKKKSNVSGKRFSTETWVRLL